ncbi:ATP-binding protein [Clostridium sp. CX1]|uniref:histidine kinase n=1 Tax=Clostridium tanneri TaxID=3037988 RepID=A0ABU4JRU7_9CLOT|nr:MULTISPECIES: MASE3 domain-containing protein [unclassified Clostridium]MCT8977763.1 ATP-binding protein [Clostridium sp. CX1]MDW8800878.1 MASE3 domain-containing protein [Clostridium sp. A1-XYC3]
MKNTTNSCETLDKFIHKKIIIIVILVIFLNLLIKNWLFTHIFIEYLTNIVGMSVCIIALNTYKICKNEFFAFLAVAFAFIFLFEFMQMAAYQGISIIGQSNYNLTVQLNLIKSYYSCITAVLAFRYIRTRLKINVIFYMFLSISFILLLSIFYFRVFPVCYIEGYGLTTFKKVSEFMICIMYIISIIKLRKAKFYFNQQVYSYLFYSLVLILASNVLFSLYINEYSTQNIVGHLLLILSYFFLYKAAVQSTLRAPFKFLFSELSIKNIRLNERNRELEYARKIAEDDRQRYKNLVENIQVPIIVKKGEKITFANKSALSLFKAKSQEELIGECLLKVVPEEHRDLVKTCIASQKEEGERNYHGLKLLALDGSYLYVDVSKLNIRYGGLNYSYFVFKDIAEKQKRKEVERKLKETMELEKLRTEFFANLSHEFRTPINVIYSALQVMDIYIKNENIYNITKYISTVRQNCYRLLRLVNNLIDITKIDAGFYKFNLKNCDIVSLVENTVESVLPYIQGNGMEITFDTDIEEKITACDPDMIERVMLNLISNSIKYRREYGGAITINIYNSDEGITISIKDNGIGIPLNKQSNIFERFVQANNLLTRKCEGSGIGLSIVKSLVEMHKGTITLISEEGEGSEFVIDIPLNITKGEECGKNLFVGGDIMEKVNIEFSDIYNLG